MNLLVDLDGTITEPSSGILAAVRHALARVDVPPPTVETLGWVIGPPLRQSFPALGVPAERLEEAIAHYRAHYVDGGGMFDADLIPGIADALRTLKGQGHRLFVATSKPRVYATPIIAHFGLADVFEAVHGAELDGRNDHKHEVIADILNTHDLENWECVMIGDTPFDVQGARAHAIPTIGCAWGHGGEALAAEKPAMIIQRADELVGAVARFGAPG